MYFDELYGSGRDPVYASQDALKRRAKYAAKRRKDIETKFPIQDRAKKLEALERAIKKAENLKDTLIQVRLIIKKEKKGKRQPKSVKIFEKPPLPPRPMKRLSGKPALPPKPQAKGKKGNVWIKYLNSVRSQVSRNTHPDLFYANGSINQAAVSKYASQLYKNKPVGSGYRRKKVKRGYY